MIEFSFSFLSFVKKKSKMLTTVQGIYENGKLELNEAPPTLEKSKVLVVFLEKTQEIKNKKKGVVLGSQVGKFDLPEDFNDPLEDLKDYM